MSYPDPLIPLSLLFLLGVELVTNEILSTAGRALMAAVSMTPVKLATAALTQPVTAVKRRIPLMSSRVEPLRDKRSIHIKERLNCLKR